jgi:hypothetical protein
MSRRRGPLFQARGAFIERHLEPAVRLKDQNRTRPRCIAGQVRRLVNLPDCLGDGVVELPDIQMCRRTALLHVLAGQADLIVDYVDTEPDLSPGFIDAIAQRLSNIFAFRHVAPLAAS